MKSFIKKIFDGETDELVHLQFQKFGKGEFKNRAMVVVKKMGGGKFSVKTGPEYAKELVMALAERLGSERVQVIGALIAAIKLEGFDYQEKKSAIGVNKYLIDKEMSGDEIVELCEKVSKAFFGLSFKIPGGELKIKTKSPKSAKGASSAKSESGVKVDFCKLKTDDAEIVKGLLFDNELGGNWKKVEISHDFVVEEIVVPEGLENEKDFGKVRALSKRKGQIIRRLNVDGRGVVKEREFEV